MIVPKVRLAAALVLFVAGTSVQTPSNGVTAQSDVDLRFDLDNAIRFRASSSLRADRSFVKGTIADRKNYPNLDWGVPLAESEAREIERRVDVSRSSRDAISYAERQPEYAGMMYDKDDGHPRFWFTAGVGEHRATIKSLLPNGLDFAVERADISMAHIRSLQARITDDATELRRDGIPVTVVGTNVERNSVSVGLAESTDGALLYLRERYGPSVVTKVVGTLVHDECWSFVNCGDPPDDPWVGGVKIHAVGQPSTSHCTTGFLGRRINNNNLVFVTAGHCFRSSNGGVGNPWEHSGRTIGDSLGKTWSPGSPDDPADVGWLDVTYTQTSPKNRLHVADVSGEDLMRTITARQNNSEQNVQDYVCRAGWVSEYACGRIADTCVNNVDVDGSIVDCLWEVDFDAIPGDSGAPYFVGNDALGIHNDSSTADYPADGYSYYTTINRIKTYADIEICLTAGC
jgi:hypothetical protein